MITIKMKDGEIYRYHDSYSTRVRIEYVNGFVVVHDIMKNNKVSWPANDIKQIIED